MRRVQLNMTAQDLCKTYREEIHMFILFATKSNNDGCKGFRFNFLGNKGIYRKRKAKKRYGIEQGDVMTGYHFGKRSVYFQQAAPKRKLYHFAG